MISVKKLFIAALTLGFAIPVCNADENVNAYGVDPNISDLALIYAGEQRRPVWNKEQLRPYVTHIYADGHEDWLFDGFLFLESTNGNIAFHNGMKNMVPGTQADWSWLLDQFFAPDRTLHALDELISDKKAELGESPLRHKVVIACPAPTKEASGSWGRSVWGSYEGKSLRFMIASDRVKAVCWYVDELLARWEAAGFKNIDLEGIYWIEEGLWSNGEIMADVNAYVHLKGLRSYWIPYYLENKQYWSLWFDKYNFDMAYIQPNYAFYDDNHNFRPYSLLEETCKAAKDYGMGLEFEFETQSTSNALHEVNPELHQHINDYMDVYDKNGVFDNAGVAYYSGTQGMIHMDKSTDPVNHATMDRLADFVVKRQKARRENAGLNQPVIEDRPIAYTDEGRIIMTADTCCHDLSGRLLHKGEGSFDCESGVYIVSDLCGHSVKLMVR